MKRSILKINNWKIFLKISDFKIARLKHEELDFPITKIKFKNSKIIYKIFLSYINLFKMSWN